MTAGELHERVQRWRATGDPQHLWPDVTRAQRALAHRAIADVTRRVLNGTESQLDEAGSLTAAALGVAAYESGMGPLVGYWIENGTVQARSELRDVLRLHLEHGRRRAQRMQDGLARVLRSAAAHSVQPIVLKGAHTSACHFPEPGVRPASDLDVLVNPVSLSPMRAALAHAGFTEVRHATYPEDSIWMADDAPRELASLDLDHADNPWSLDLHTALAKDYFRGVRAGFGAHAFTCVEERDLSGVRALVLAQPLLTAYHALNASYGIDELRILKLVELVYIMRTDAVDWHALQALLEATGTERFVYPAFTLCARLVPDIVPDRVLERLDRAATPRMRSVVAAAELGGMHLARRSLGEKLMWSQGPREIAWNLIAMWLPPEEGMTLRQLGQAYARRVRVAVGRQMALRF